MSDFWIFQKSDIFWSTPIYIIYGNLHFLANLSITGPPRVPLAEEQILMPRNAPAPRGAKRNWVKSWDENMMDPYGSVLGGSSHLVSGL